MNYSSLIKMDMHELVMYYRLLVDEVKKENEEMENSSKGNTGNPGSLPNFSNFKMPEITMPSINFGN